MARGARKWVAPPGRSNHNNGFAADLRYASPEARAWAHQNAGQYGLAFPLGNEPWHVELAGARGPHAHGGEQGVAPASAAAPAATFGSMSAGGGAQSSDASAALIASGGGQAERSPYAKLISSLMQSGGPSPSATAPKAPNPSAGGKKLETLQKLIAALSQSAPVDPFGGDPAASVDWLGVTRASS